MDANTVTVIVVVAIAIVLITGLILFRRHNDVDTTFTGPGGMKATLKAGGRQSERRVGVRQVDIEGRNVTGNDATGDGVEQRGVRAIDDVVATATYPKDRIPKKA